jgi:cation diffusion facilitator CzcD-associated flavoprotein CzcO
MALPMRQRQLDDAGKRALKVDMHAKYAKRARTRAGYDFDYLDYAGPTCAGMSDEQIVAMWDEAFWEEGGFVPWLGNFPEIYTDERLNLMAYEFWRDKVRQRIKDPAVAEKLAPTKPPHPYGVKRISLEQRFYEVFNQPNVTLVDLNETPIARVTRAGVETVGGRVHELDLLVLATGFDMVTGGLTAMNIVGTHGTTLRQQWQQGVSAYMGTMTHGFPNMLFVYGPQAPSGLSNGPSCSELQGDEIVALLEHMRDAQSAAHRVEAPQADQAWRQRIDEFAAGTLVQPRAVVVHGQQHSRARPPQMINYPIGMPDYLEQWRQVKAADYTGFELR